jgi:hypothetical protein
LKHNTLHGIDSSFAWRIDLFDGRRHKLGEVPYQLFPVAKPQPVVDLCRGVRLHQAINEDEKDEPYHEIPQNNAFRGWNVPITRRVQQKRRSPQYAGQVPRDDVIVPRLNVTGLCKRKGKDGQADVDRRREKILSTRIGSKQDAVNHPRKRDGHHHGSFDDLACHSTSDSSVLFLLMFPIRGCRKRQLSIFVVHQGCIIITILLGFNVVVVVAHRRAVHPR